MTAQPLTERPALEAPQPAAAPDHAGDAALRATTVVKATPDDAPAESRRVLRAIQQRDAFALIGSGSAALGLSSLVYSHFAPFSGAVGYVVVTFALFVFFYAAVTSIDESGPVVRERIAAAIIHGLAALLLGTLAVVVAYTFARGHDALVHANFYTQDLKKAGPLQGLGVGGVRQAIIGTLEQISIALVITVPLGVTCAVFLTEFPGAFSRIVRTIAEAMTALPSIVAGLFIYATWILALGQGKSGFAASLAISVMMLPIVIRASDVVLRLVPGPLKEASLALGAGQWRTVWKVTLPTAKSGLATAVILGAARGIGETSPVLLTAGYTNLTNGNPFKGPMVSLPLAAFELSASPQHTEIARGFGAASVLLALVLVLFMSARVIGGRGPGELSERQRKARVRASARDVERINRALVRVPAEPTTHVNVLPPAVPHPHDSGAH